MSPLDRPKLSDPIKIQKLCFTSCCNVGFYEGAIGLARSIRKFYTKDEADIVFFFNSDMRPDHIQNFIDLGCEVHGVDEIDYWFVPLVYGRPEYASDTSHFYHPDYQLPAGLEYRQPTEHGLTHLRHKHPLNIKAFCTAYCLVVRGYARVCHVDSDAFLLSKIDVAFERANGKQDCVIGWDDGEDQLQHYEAFFKDERQQFCAKRYTFNAGIVFYTNGPGIHRLMLDFMFYIESPCHYKFFDNDQGLLRALVMYHAQKKNIVCDIADGKCWNPTWFRADHLELRGDEWINLDVGLKQYIWHGAGGEKTWTGRYTAAAVNAAWIWAGGVITG